MKNIPNTLRFHRKQRKLTQNDIADHLGLKSTDRISRWEQGLKYPHIINLFKMAKFYQVLPHELYPELFENVHLEVDPLEKELIK